jgi:predicted transcriptional regulator
MEIHVRPDLQAKLDRVAAENNRDAEEYVLQLVEHHVDHDAWFREQAVRQRELPVTGAS